MKKNIPGFKNYSVSLDGTVTNNKSGRNLKPRINISGYYILWMYEDKIRYQKFVHRIIMEAFNPNTNPDYNQVNHKNGIKTDNRVENLEWCNNSINQLHAYEHNLHKPLLNNKCPSRKLDEIQTLTIRSCKESGMRTNDLAKYFNVCRHTISKIATRKTWRTL